MIAITGNNCINEAYKKNNNDFISSIGRNSGNLVFQYAVWNILQDTKVHMGDISIDKINSECTHLVVPSANFIREDSDLTDFIRYLKKIKIPIVFLGLGAQGPNYAYKKLLLHQSIRDLLSLIKDRCEIVGVRGNYSQEILESHGIKNSLIIGCPSNFINQDNTLYDRLYAKWKNEVEHIALVANEPWNKEKLHRLTEQKLFSLACQYNNSIYIQQSVEPIIQFIRAKNNYSNLQKSDNLEPKILGLHKALAPNLSLDIFKQNFYNKIRLYISVNQWMEDISRMDFCCGTRIHGNIIAHQSGCPSVVVYHDARTRELAETMSYPLISMESFIKCPNVEDVKNLAINNFDTYKSQKKILKNNFIKLLTHYNLKHKFV